MSRSKKGSEFLSALGTMFEIWKAITDRVVALGGNDMDVRQILSRPSVRDAVVNVLMRQRFLADGFPVEIYWDRTVCYYKQRFDLLGGTIDQQDTTRLIDEEIANRQPGQPVMTRNTLHVIELDAEIEIENVEELTNMYRLWNARPATVVEAINFGAQYPMEQRLYPICTVLEPFRMGSMMGKVSCLFLYCDKNGKSVCEYNTANPWDKDIRFLVVKK